MAIDKIILNGTEIPIELPIEQVTGLQEALDNAGTIKSVSVNGTDIEPDEDGNVDITVGGGADWDAEQGEDGYIENKPTIPANTSDLTNDAGFVTAQDVSGMVAATADLTIVENEYYIDITISSPALTVTSLAPMSATTKSGTFKVSGTHLKGDVTISMSATNWTMSVGGGAALQTLTLSPTDGILAETTITVTYSGSTDSTGNTITIASQDAVSKTVTANYTITAGPTILADDSLTIKAATGQSNTGTLQVTGSQLTAGITASVSGTGFTVSSSENGTYGNQASLPSSGGTLYVKFSPTGSTGSTGTLTLESTGATSKTVTLTGAVATLTVSPSSLSFSTEAGTPATKTFTVQGANLTQDISISASGTGFSVSPATIDKDDAATEQTVTVTYSPSETGTNTGSITLQSGGASANVTLEGTASAGLPAGYTKLTYLQGITRQMQSPSITYPQTWEFDVQCDALTSNIQILACASSAGGKWVGASNNGKWGVGITDATCTTVQVTTRATVTATLKSTGVEITIGNETITRNADSALTGYIWLFGCNETDKRLFGGKVYSVRLVSGGTADLVLASRDSDGQHGIYNLTNNTFYGLT